MVAALTLLLVIGFASALPGFATTANALDLMRRISKLGILGMGLIVIGRGIDVSEVAIIASSWSVTLAAIPHGLPPL
jgi:ribose transport system permease protein